MDKNLLSCSAIIAPLESEAGKEMFISTQTHLVPHHTESDQTRQNYVDALVLCFYQNFGKKTNINSNFCANKSLFLKD